MSDLVGHVIAHGRAREAHAGNIRYVDLGPGVWSRVRAERIARALRGGGWAARIVQGPYTSYDEITIHYSNGEHSRTWWRDDLAPHQLETYAALRADGTSPDRAARLATALEGRR